MNIQGMNSEEYMEDPFLKSELKRAEVEITDIKDATANNNKAVDVFFKVISSPFRTHRLRERYYLQGPHVDTNGEKKNGSLWKFRNLVIACGFFEEKDDGNGIMHRHVQEPFNPTRLKGKICFVDVTKKDKYLRVENETHGDDLLKQVEKETSEKETLGIKDDRSDLNPQEVDM
jgi:hypothetical protein